MFKLSRKLSVMLALTALVVLQGLVYAGPCYVRSGGTVNCLSAGGPHCSTIAADGLPCPGGAWSVADAVQEGLNLADPCSLGLVVHQIPTPNATSGNQAVGQMQQGNFSFPCVSVRSCTKGGFWLIPVGPWMTDCTAVLLGCTSHTVFTAGGAPCPPPAPPGS